MCVCGWVSVPDASQKVNAQSLNAPSAYTKPSHYPKKCGKKKKTVVRLLLAVWESKRSNVAKKVVTPLGISSLCVF